LSRVGFDQRVTLQPDEEVIVDDLPSATQSLDDGWALAASLGVEGTVREGPVGISLALAGLIPIMPAESDLGDTRSFDAIGAEVRIGVGVVLASRSR
jgi:hypothetical protein